MDLLCFWTPLSFSPGTNNRTCKHLPQQSRLGTSHDTRDHFSKNWVRRIQSVKIHHDPPHKHGNYANILGTEHCESKSHISLWNSGNHCRKRWYVLDRHFKRSLCRARDWLGSEGMRVIAIANTEGPLSTKTIFDRR